MPGKKNWQRQGPNGKYHEDVIFLFFVQHAFACSICPPWSWENDPQVGCSLLSSLDASVDVSSYPFGSYLYNACDYFMIFLIIILHHPSCYSPKHPGLLQIACGLLILVTWTWVDIILLELIQELNCGENVFLDLEHGILKKYMYVTPTQRTFT
jgi:hypothetical protein